jgi:hypothetical protein
MFNVFWGLYLSIWIYKVRPQTWAVAWYAALTVAYPLALVIRFVLGPKEGLNPLPVDLFALLQAAVGIAARYSLAWTLQNYFSTTENYRLRLSGIMIFFFGIYYLQYHLREIRQLQNAAFPAPRLP